MDRVGERRTEYAFGIAAAMAEPSRLYEQSAATAAAACPLQQRYGRAIILS
jgi:hypothetical protein